MVGLLVLALTLALVAAAPAAAHHGGVPAGDAAAGPGTKVSLRGCFLTAALVPRKAAALQPFFRRPVDLSMTFYGPDPLLAIWAISCDGARVAGKPAGTCRRLARERADRADQRRRAPAREQLRQRHRARGHHVAAVRAGLREGGLPARVTEGPYSHSPAAAVPSRGRLAVRNGYTVTVGRATSTPPTRTTTPTASTIPPRRAAPAR